MPLPIGRRALCGWLCVIALAGCAQQPLRRGAYAADPRDLAAIMQVTEDFRAALLGKDAKRLSDLLLHERILFASPASPTRVRKMRAAGDASFDGVDAAGAVHFLEFVANAREPIEERFHDIQVMQDGHLAWVTFDFEFLEGGKVQNVGLESWQMLKTADERWKILSVVWSSRGVPQ